MTFALIMSLCFVLGAFGRISMKKALVHKPPLVCSLMFVIAEVIVALPFFFWYQNPTTLYYSFMAGVIFAASIFFYFLSFHNGEVSLLSIFRALRGVVALIISILWWHEVISFWETIGTLLIGFGMLVLYKGSRFTTLFRFLFHREALYMMLSVIFGVIATYYDKEGVRAIGIYSHYLWTNIFSMLTLFLVVMVKYRIKMWNMISKNFSHHNFTVGVLFAGAYAMVLLALQYERITIVNALLPLTTLLTIFLAQKYLQETIREKIPGAILVVLGTALISLL